MKTNIQQNAHNGHALLEQIAAGELSNRTCNVRSAVYCKEINSTGKLIILQIYDRRPVIQFGMTPQTKLQKICEFAKRLLRRIIISRTNSMFLQMCVGNIHLLLASGIFYI